MSFHIIYLNNKTHREIFAVSDKRSMAVESTSSGEIVNWKFDNDDQEKNYQVNEDVLYIGGIAKEIKIMQAHLSTVKHLKPSEIIQSIKDMDRAISPPWGPTKYDTVILFGIYDDGNPFVFQAERDGSYHFKLVLPDDRHLLLCGGSPGTEEKAGAYLIDLLQTKILDDVTIMDAFGYAARIDKRQVISNTVDIYYREF